MKRTSVLRPPKHILILPVLTFTVAASATATAQNRDLRAERIVIDDDGADGTQNTMTIRTPDSLAQDVILTVPDPGTSASQFLLVPSGSSGAWLLNGNAGTVAGTDFMGTSDATPLHLYVNGGANNSLLLNTNGSIQRGLKGNVRGVGAIDLQNVNLPFHLVTQVASGESSTIGGGRQNTASGSYAVVAGGTGHTASGSGATVAGGGNNTASQNYSSIGGGFENIASGIYTTVSGGGQNAASQSQATVGGGFGNTASGLNSTVGGGGGNTAAGMYSAIPGGDNLTLSGGGSFGFNARDNVPVSAMRPMTVAEPKTVVFGNADLWLANNDGTAGRLRLYEGNSETGDFPVTPSGTVHYSSFEAGDQSEDINYVLPTALPTSSGQVLSSDMNGVMSWYDVLSGYILPTSLPVTNGQVLSSDTNGVMSWDVPADAWLQEGNAGTVAGTHFIGTTDDEPFQIHVDDGNTNGTDGRGRVMRFEPNGTSPNIVGGYQGNSVAAGSGITIAGGGRNGSINGVASDFGTIGGGRGNSIVGSNTAASTIGGGRDNGIANFSESSTIAGGVANSIRSNAPQSAIGGGNGNTIDSSATSATIAGGTENFIAWRAAGGAIGGGNDNTLGYLARFSSIPGGRGLRLNGHNSFGYLANQQGNLPMTVGDDNVAVFGNTDLWLANNRNTASALRFYEAETDTGAFPSSTNFTSFEAGTQTGDIRYILPAALPTAGQILRANSVTSTIVALTWGDDATGTVTNVWSLTGNSGTTPGTNFIGTGDSTALHIYVDSGNANALTLNTNGSIQHGTGGAALGPYAVDLQHEAVAGVGATARSAVIAGGESNHVSNLYGTVGGGIDNAVTGRQGTIGGGIANRVYATSATAGGGYNNIVSGNYSVIAGGRSNVVAGGLSTVLGGRNLVLDTTASGSVGFLGDPSGVGPMRIGQRQVAVFGNTDLWLANNDNGAGRLVFYEANSVTGNFPVTDSGMVHSTTFEAGEQSEDINYTLPTLAPTSNGQVLSSDTNGVMNWADGPSGAQSFANASNAVSTLTLGNSAAGSDGTALEITTGRVLLSMASGAPATLPDDISVYEIDDATGSSVPTVALPAGGSGGQILYIYISDPDGATVGGAVRGTGDKLTYVFVGGAWQLFAVN